MSVAPYPEFVKNLPRADVPVDGICGYLFQGADHQVVFFDIDPVAKIPEHSHGDQWGIVVEGQMDLTIAGQTRRYGPGDSYHIPAGAMHSAVFLSRVRVIDVFADRERYQAST